MKELWSFKVFSATDGVYTIYSVTHRMTNSAAEIAFSCDFKVIEEIVDLSQENISNLNKMHVLKVKTGYDSDDVLNAILKTINNCEDNHLDLFVDNASINDQIIITNWLESN